MSSDARTDTVERTTHIDAPLEEVFAYTTDPANQHIYWSNIDPIERHTIEFDQEERPNRWPWTYSMAGKTYHGVSTVESFDENRCTIVRSEGDIESTQVVTYCDVDGKTEVREKITYDIPPNLRLLAPVVKLFNRQDLKSKYAKLQALLESEHAKPQATPEHAG